MTHLLDLYELCCPQLRQHKLRCCDVLLSGELCWRICAATLEGWVALVQHWAGWSSLAQAAET